MVAAAATQAGNRLTAIGNCEAETGIGACDCRFPFSGLADPHCRLGKVARQ